MNESKKIKHLEFIQLVITRMNVNSFLIKGWSVTLVSALFIFASKDTDISYMIITYVSTPVFWFLDGYYLSQERQYRELYNEIRERNEEEINFDMSTVSYNTGRNTWFRSATSNVVLTFYASLFLLTLLVMFIIN
jgi:hypothetical protein